MIVVYQNGMICFALASLVNIFVSSVSHKYAVVMVQSSVEITPVHQYTRFDFIAC